MEWPRGSGRIQIYPEVDKACWFDVATARIKLHAGQVGFVDQLLERLGISAEQGALGAAGETGPKQLKLL